MKVKLAFNEAVSLSHLHRLNSLTDWRQDSSSRWRNSIAVNDRWWNDVSDEVLRM